MLDDKGWDGRVLEANTQYECYRSLGSEDVLSVDDVLG